MPTGQPQPLLQALARDEEDMQIPIVGAPMAGGATTPALVAAVSEAGGLGFLDGGYQTASQMTERIGELRLRTERPFGVNLFVPGVTAADPVHVQRYGLRIAREALQVGVELGDPAFDDDDWHAKLDLLCAHPVPIVSFTFGAPPADVVARLQRAKIRVWITVTDVDEATRAEDVGADALVVQGAEAGGHRGCWTDTDHEPLGLLALLQLVRSGTHLPLVAAGGIASGAAVSAAICAGATAAQIGTALLRTDEAGTADAHRDAVGWPTTTGITRAFTGRRARAIRNRFFEEHDAHAPSAYPEIHHLTAPLRAHAREKGDTESMHLWAGQTHPLTQDAPAGELVRRMADDARTALQHAGALLGD